ncbi:phage terminase large subunit [Paracoccus methylovorus]|uniref:Phage terminase large subunit n=2 Tax=Paracoccus methylovorus TaxID=2812658 RepID=A0ABX7JKF8_9RHOB|nr:phage terminase large subunit [Paracoccus methylovorus]QRZ14722.1 phage terminase large subunit [Paracoccus methylovorus]
MILKPDTPAVFEPLWTQSARYKGAHGGRGSAKSWDRGQHLVFRHAMEPGLNSACLREVQATLKDSVFKLIEDTARRLEVGGLFTPVPSDSHIKCPGGGVMIFRGMNDMNADNIKSLEGFDIAWWEEAQTATQRSLDLLRPTIRKPGSELWFSWNPRLRGDPVDVMLRQDRRFEPERIVVEANWRDNPMRGAELEKERLLDLAGDEARYRHIWEGDYEAESDMQFIGGGLVREAMAREPNPTIGDELVLGVDVARFGDDRTVIWARRGRDAKTMPPIILKGADTMQVAARVMAEIDRLKPDGVFIDEGGVGGGVVDRCRQMGYSVIGVNFGGKADRAIEGVPKCRNKRAQMWATMREWLREGGCIPDSRDLEMDLTGPLYGFDVNNAIEIEKKSDMKKRGVSSPDEADALALTFAYPVVARSIRRQQEAQAQSEWHPVW